MPSLVSDVRGTRVMTGLVPALYDNVTITYPSSTVQVYSFYMDGNPVGVVTITYDLLGNIIQAQRTG